MKSMKLVCLLVSVLLAGFLAGCVNPISPAPGAKESAPAQAAPEDGPAFTVTLTLTENEGARSIAGVTGKLAGWSSLINNIGQLVVVDKDTRKIIYCGRDIRTADNSPEMTFSIGAISFDKEYVFMLLMGHKERTNYDATSGYDYKNTPPTLLLAGTKTYTLLSGDKKVEIDMWPLVVDTKFVANQGKTSQLAPLEPVTVTNKPGVVFVPPTATRVEWKVVQGTNGANGFTNLFAAHKLFHKNGQFQMTTGGRTIVRGDGIDSGNPKIVEMGFSDINSTNSLEEVAVGVSTIYLNIDDYTNGLNRIGKLGSVNFELDYVPFGPDIWTETENGNKNVDNPIKKWIIRNGINSEPQDNNTIFIVPGQSKDNTPLTWGTSGANGNGAIRFKPAVGPGGGDNPDNPGWNIPGLDNLKITTGEYKGSSKINFTLAGIPEGKGQVYYKVASSKPTAISDYIYKDEYYNGLAENVSINPAPGTNDYIFLLLYKDGKIATKKIDTSAAPEIGTIIHTGE